MRQKLFSFLLLMCVSFSGFATTRNVAPLARATASSEKDGEHAAACVNDGIIRILGRGSWVSDVGITPWGEISFPWVQLDWDQEMCIDRVLIYDLPEQFSTCSGGELFFDNGECVHVWGIPSDGSPCEIHFPARRTKSLRFRITDGDCANIGLSEIEVYEAAEAVQDYVQLVDPYIETTRGRYFFFVTGSTPFGMIGAAPLTRNKNQGGGGYNYNSTEVLGFPQVHGWMLGGLDLMPTTGKVDPRGGEQGWKSSFKHEGEVVQPAYHRMYLERYGMWVEQTTTDRASIYWLTSSADAEAQILLNLGGYVSTATMINAHAKREGDTLVTGYFDTAARLWGGPDKVRIYFVAQFDRPFDSMSAWSEDELVAHADSVVGPVKFTESPNGMGLYKGAPTAGVGAHYKMKAGDALLLKMAVSYTSVENARQNLSEIPGWDFDAVREQSQREWNDMLGRIEVKGGQTNDRVKLYTDLWHTLLGRHKLDDLSGDYPDYTKGGTFQGTHTVDAKLTVRNTGKRFHMYNSDAFWLTQWNLNILWGLAYPEVLDDFAASLLQYSINGDLLPRGPCAGGYSFIMAGCPATSLISSAYQRGITHRWSPKTALREMVRNHERGGMLAYGMDNEYDFYVKNGYVPNNAGLTVQWTFEDWALAEMAAAMGNRRVASRFHKRAEGWSSSFNEEKKMMLPRKEDGTWCHTDLLSGWGFLESNSWQCTFGLSHDIPRLAAMMGGNDTLCSRLDYAFRQAVSSNFMSSYSNGYVSYANQPGASNAHVFAHAGHPELTQYWVRRVRRQAYGDVTPDMGYGGHDEDQGQMGGVSALMSLGFFALDGCSGRNPSYDITSPLFDEITIHLNRDYYSGNTFRIRTYGNSEENCYINRATLNGNELDNLQVSHTDYERGGELELWMSDKPAQVKP